MKKTSIKAITFLMLCVFISSCEKDDGIYESETKESNFLLEESIVSDDSDKIAKSSNCQSWSILSYEGEFTWISGEDIPHVGTYINAEANRDNGVWAVSGSFKIIGDSNRKNVQVQRISKAAGWLQFYYVSEGSIYYCTKNYIEIPDSIAPCPTSEHTEMSFSERTKIVKAINYDNDFTYQWLIQTHRETKYRYGSSITLGSEDASVRLSVSNTGCETKVNQRNFYPNR